MRKNLLLANIALIIFILLEPISFFYTVIVKKHSAKGYLISFAVDLDRFGNHQYRTLFNSTLIKKTSEIKFGNFNETISSVLGKIELNSEVELIDYKIFNKKIFTYRKFHKTEYTKLGIFLNRFLNLLDKNHCINSINNF